MRSSSLDLNQQPGNVQNARGGPVEPFNSYDPCKTAPKFSWDGTGAATTRAECAIFTETYE